ncbi:Protein of unknown function [Humidesulfovibrio mexicanus]|uniref:DUF3644 domain-containing protein n=1 Tax=Humidesulfovibrio mexicanus TaxID=147047 RepID=A0A238YW00_9BACT|nr:DUF3644 domain-containing protein [Humidesulfovibrio mexicanus]SNR74753.1 Protein of unknown function [Humidesulfovibrio mexicanus]
MRRPLCKKFLDKSYAAIIGAIEIYNKPNAFYREEAFAILSVNAWELLLKAKILKDNNNNKKSICEYKSRSTKRGEKTKRQYLCPNRAGNPKTISILNCISVIAKTPSSLDKEIVDNVNALIEIRDNATHCVNTNPILVKQIFEISCACIKNFILLAKKWFSQDFSNSISLVVPLAFIDGSKEVESITVSPDESRLIKYLQHIAKENGSTDSEYSVAIRLDIKYEKSSLASATKVISSKDPDAIKIELTEEDFKRIYPWDYGELLTRLKNRYIDFKQNRKFYDTKRPLMNNPQLVQPRYLDPDNHNGTKKDFYSPNIMSKFDPYYKRAEEATSLPINLQDNQ